MKSNIIDIHYVNFITFNISNLFFLDLLCLNWGASYMLSNMVTIFCTQLYSIKY